MTKRELLQMALEALVETTGLATNYEAVKEKGGHEFADALMVIELGNVVIATLRAELAKTEPDTIAWACWLEDADPATDTPQLCTYEPMAYRQRIPLIRKDDL